MPCMCTQYAHAPSKGMRIALHAACCSWCMFLLPEIINEPPTTACTHTPGTMRRCACKHLPELQTCNNISTVRHVSTQYSCCPRQGNIMCEAATGRGNNFEWKIDLRPPAVHSTCVLVRANMLTTKSCSNLRPCTHSCAKPSRHQILTTAWLQAQQAALLAGIAVSDN